MSEEELDLSALSDDELVAQMHDDLYDGLADEIDEGTRILLDRGWSAQKVLNEALVEAMRTGSAMVIKGTSNRGTTTTDTYSLSGTSAAYEAINKACNVKR